MSFKAQGLVLQNQSMTNMDLIITFSHLPSDNLLQTLYNYFAHSSKRHSKLQNSHRFWKQRETKKFEM